MTSKEFAMALRNTRMRSEPIIQGCRLMLVHGLTSYEAADELEKQGTPRTSQQLRAARRRLVDAFVKRRGSPLDWACVTVVVPFKHARKIKEVERRLHYAHGLPVENLDL